MPGAATPTELLSLMARGFRVCKLFPASAVGGLAMLKGLAGPMSDLKICPTGGITEDNAADYLAQPNVVCIGGSWMVPKDWIDAGEWDKVASQFGQGCRHRARVRDGLTRVFERRAPGFSGIETARCRLRAWLVRK